MRVALPKFNYRFVPSLGHVIHPGNFHPVGVHRTTRQMIERLSVAPRDSKRQAWAIVGGSGGFGSAARAVLGISHGAHTLNVSYDPQPNPDSNNKIRQLGSVGFHRNSSLEQHLRERDVVARTINGDAFSPDIRAQAIAEIREHMGGKIDGLVWALAAPRAIDVRTGNAVASALKPLGRPVKIKTFSGADDRSREAPRIQEIEMPPGSPEEAIATIFVMGGGVVAQWVEALAQADVLAPGFTLLTISYRGNPLNEGVYRKGLIGLAKADLEFQTRALDAWLKSRVGGRALAVEGPAVVTEASGGIPGVPYYMAHLLDVMGKSFEDPLDSMRRMFAEKLHLGSASQGVRPEAVVDEEGLVRMDERELSADVQEQMRARFDAASPGQPFSRELYEGFMTQYAMTRGFAVEGVDYEAEFDTVQVCRGES